jgi:hypothetical protein
MRRLELLRLNAANDQRRQKQNCRENKKQFESCEEAGHRLHGFTLYHKVNCRFKHFFDVHRISNLF